MRSLGTGSSHLSLDTGYQNNNNNSNQRKKERKTKKERKKRKKEKKRKEKRKEKKKERKHFGIYVTNTPRDPKAPWFYGGV